MAVLLTCNSLEKRFGHRLLFAGITLGLHDGERCGLIGRNGSGKTTLLRVLAGLEAPDGGDVIRRRNLRVGLVPQEEDFTAGQTVTQVLMDRLQDLPLEPHERQVRAATELDRAGFVDGQQRVETLSGGWRKRLAIARELVGGPDLVVLDEPTNHLDIEGILWLEDLLRNARWAWLTISHDRYLLQNTARRIVEIGPEFADGFFEAAGSYSQFLERREAYLESQQRREQSLRAQARREIEWLERGPQGRGTKARARQRSAQQLMGELADTQRQLRSTGGPRVDFAGTERQADKLVELKRVSKSYGERKLFEDLDLILSSKMRLGIVGFNGSGKTTMLRTIAGTLEPDTGKVKHAEGLRVAVFDQDRSSLDPDQPLRRALAPSGEHVEFRGNSIHVVGWARRFLFRPEQLDMPVGTLSGGEQARILTARAMLRPADLLILDEPSNDLDIPTLDVLEQSLLDFPGAIVLVTHDRYLLDRVSTEIMGLDGQGGTRWFADFADWLEYERERERERSAARKREAPKPAPTRPRQQKKLSYHLQRELDGMEDAIAEAEADAARWREEVQKPDVLSDADRMHTACEALGAAERRVEALFARWAELDEMAGG